MDIVVRNGFGQCEELIRQASLGKLLLCEHVEFDWGFSSDNSDGVDFSEDEIEEREKPFRHSQVTDSYKNLAYKMVALCHGWVRLLFIA